MKSITTQQCFIFAYKLEEIIAFKIYHINFIVFSRGNDSGVKIQSLYGALILFYINWFTSNYSMYSNIYVLILQNLNSNMCFFYGKLLSLEYNLYNLMKLKFKKSILFLLV